MRNNKGKPKLRTEKYIIGYIDLLGSKEKILGNDSDYWLNVVNTLYNDAWKRADLLKKTWTYDKPFIKVFSDNILIAEKLHDDDNKIGSSIIRIFNFLAYIQTHALLDYKWMVRGSVLVGDLYISDPEEDGSRSFIWGKGVIRAYELEDTIALYPRILVDKILFDVKRDPSLGEDLKNHRFILKDSDGLFYLNYLEMYLDEKLLLAAKMHKTVDENQTIVQISSILSEMERKYKDVDSIIQKVAWTRHYLELVKSDKEYLDKTPGSRRYISKTRFIEEQES